MVRRCAGVLAYHTDAGFRVVAAGLEPVHLDPQSNGSVRIDPHEVRLYKAVGNSLRIRLRHAKPNLYLRAQTTQ